MDRTNNTRNACVVEGCGKPATRVSSQMCEKHYYRQRRNGTTDYIGNAIPDNLEHTNGYVLQAAPGHPCALGSHRAYQHRVVFYDAHGEGPFNCHWCGVVVTWEDMHVDHVDADRKNNSLTNLVSSCASCNHQRGREKMIQTFRSRYGVTINGRTQTLNEWASEVGISRTSIIARLKAGWTHERAVMEPRGKFGPQRKII